MARSISRHLPRRLLGALAAIVVVVLLTASPAAAWSGSARISGYDWNSLMFSNPLLLVTPGHVNFFYSSEYGPTYRRTDLNLQSETGEIPLKLTGDNGDAEGIAADGGLLATVYRNLIGVDSIELRTSTTGGTSWNPAVTLASYNSAALIGSASVAVSGQTVLVAWTDSRNGHVNLRRSTNGGTSFGSIELLGTSTSFDVTNVRDAQVQLGVSGSKVVATWFASHQGQAPKRLVLRRSSNLGASFSATQTLDAGPQAYDGPSVAMSGDEVLVTHATKAGTVMLLRSANAGKTFSTRNLSGTGRTYDRTDVAIDPAHPLSVRAVWFTAGGRVFMRRSADGGASWSAREDTGGRAHPYSVTSPNVVVSGVRTVVAWNGQVNDDYVWQVISARTDG